jgi:two-component system, NarL family, sensor kinase
VQRVRSRDRAERVRSGPLRRELVVFLSVAVLTMVGVGLATVLISEKIARDTALHEAEQGTLRMGEVLIEPLLSEALTRDRAPLDHVIADRLEDGSVTEVRVWTADGVVVYSSEPADEGRSVEPSEKLLAASRGVIGSGLVAQPELDSPPASQGPFLEVYAPIVVDGQPLVFEAFFSAAVIDRSAALLRGRIVPLAIGAIVVLQLVQVPIAVSLGRRLSRQEIERRQLIERSLRASDRERQAIAADMHDGPVQELAGVSYALGGLRARLPEAYRSTVDWLLGAHQGALASLRSLMVNIHPPDLAGDGLGAAFEDLAERLQDHDMAVHVTQDPELPELSPTAAGLLYRSGREGLANVDRHAQARTAWVHLAAVTKDGSPAVRLTIADDGIGFPDDGSGRAENGHLGLRLVRDRITSHGGSVTLGHRPGGGAVVDIVLPVHAGA